MNEGQQRLHALKLTSLHKSIEHWEHIVSFATKKEDDLLAMEGWSGASCQCCKDFYDNIDEGHTCRNCPISEDTGCDECYGTPWGSAHAAIGDWVNAGEEFYNKSEIESRRVIAVSMATTELLYLKTVYRKLLEISDEVS